MKTMKLVPMLLILILVLAFHEHAEAQYKVPSSVFGSGGAPLNNGSYRISGTVGQPVIGLASSSSHISEVGFWYLSGGLITSVEQISSSLPTEYRLEQNYPNPFNPGTTIEFSLPHSCYVTLTLYNTLGEKVATLIDENRSAGRYSVKWNPEGLATGIYFYRLQAGSFVQSKKLVVLK